MMNCVKADVLPNNASRLSRPIKIDSKEITMLLKNNQHCRKQTIY